MTSFPDKLFHSFNQILKNADLLKNELHFVAHEGSDFSRRPRKLSFKDTVMCILSMAGKPIREELLDYFDYDNHTPTASAFVQARSKITSDTFRFLFDELNIKFPATSTYRGYRLITVDGSRLQIPTDMNDSDTLYTSGSKQKNISGYNINASYDILNHRYVDMIVQGVHSINEMEAMWTMASRFHEDKTIFIADRNYATWNTMAHIMNSNKHFLIRSKDIHSSTGILKKFDLPNKDFDMDLSITLTTKQTEAIRMHPETYRFLSTSSTFDFFDKEVPFYKIKFRVVRFKLENEYQSIVTNLNRDEFNMDDIKELYHKRWCIEVSFRHLKYSADLCAVHARKRQNIQQEIWARIILYNLSLIIIQHISKVKMNDKRRKTKYAYAMNITRAIHHCRNYIRQRKRKGDASPNLELHISNELLPIRPGRKNERNVHTQPVVCFNYRFS